MISPKNLKRIGVIGGAIALAALIAHSGGLFNFSRIAPGQEPSPPGEMVRPVRTITAQKTQWPECFEAVGAVRPRTETKVEAQISGKVLKVEARPGAMVQQGQLLVLLDAQQYDARLGQARQDLNAARAAAVLARAEHGRLERLFQRGAAPKRDLDRAVENLARAQAMVQRAEDQVEEARLAQSYASVKAPDTGRITERLIEPGDIALPGRTLFLLETGGAPRLEALVREGLMGRVRLGQELEVVIPALDKAVLGRVEEIVPAVDPRTRTFLVKVVLPPTQGLYSGMFGRLRIPVGQRPVVTVESAAIGRVGQLEMVRVKDGDNWRGVYVTTGRARDGQIEVLSGLAGGETLAVEGDRP